MSAIVDTPLLNQSNDLMFSFHSKAVDSHGLKVRSFVIREGLNELCSADIELVSGRGNLDIDKFMNTEAQLLIEDRFGGKRAFSGVVELAERRDTGHFRTYYRMRLMPKLHHGRFRTNCRIFQDMTIQQIIETLLQEAGISDYRFNFFESHPARSYCVQYRESDYEFIVRILAEEGAWFFFEHSENGHKLIFTDVSKFAEEIPVTPKLEYNSTAGGYVKGSHITSLTIRQQIEVMRVVLQDRYFLNPAHDFQAEYGSIEGAGSRQYLEHFDYPGRHKEDWLGKAHAQHRLEYRRMLANLCEGKGYCPHMTAGKIYHVTEHPHKDTNRRYFLTEVEHRGTQPTALEDEVLLDGHEDRGEHRRDHRDQPRATLASAFKFVSTLVPYRPQQQVKPVIHGLQTATVVGPKSETIYTDQYSRVKLQLPWDRYGKSDENSSCWVRVAMTTGGGSWGHVSIPRVGHQVLVAYTEGDPDQPVVVGRLYHATNQTPYQLPHHKTKTVMLRSDTYQGEGFNEMSAEDMTGQENLFVHAQRDHTVKVRNNHTQRVDASSVQSVGASQAVEVGASASQQVGGGLNTVVGAVGGSASSLLTPLVQGLMGQSGMLLQEAMAIVQKASGGAGGGGSSQAAPAAAGAAAGAPSGGAGGGLMGAAAGMASSVAAKEIGSVASKAGAAGGLISAAAGMLVHAAPQLLSELMSHIGSHATNLMTGSLGSVSGMFDQLRGSVNNATPNDQRTSGGASMSSATPQVADAVGGMLGGGVHNTVVGRTQNTTVGAVQTEQIGTAKVLTVGQVYMERVGHTRAISVGEEFIVEVGAEPEQRDQNGNVTKPATPAKSFLIMKGDGTIIMKGIKFEFDADTQVQILSKVIHNN